MKQKAVDILGTIGKGKSGIVTWLHYWNSMKTLNREIKKI